MTKTFFKFLMLAAALLLTAATSTTAQIKVHSIGDSTMQTYDESSTDKRGWAQMLQQFFDANFVTVNNRGKSGASSKSFYNEAAYWPTMVASKSSNTTIEQGDYVLIQFAHNDEKNNGMDGDEVIAYYKSIGNTTEAASTDYRGTTPFNTFKKYIRAFIDETKARGGIPIIVTPICRKYFSGSNISRKGQHDLGDGFAKLTESGITTNNKLAESDNTMDYVQALKDVACEYDDVPVVDITELTRKMYLSYGNDFCTSNIFCSDDSTHPKALGATLVARLFAQAVKNGENAVSTPKSSAVLANLAKYVVVSNEVSLSPSDGDLGTAYIGMTVTKEFNISAFGLAKATGTFTFKTEGGFEVSTDKTNFSNSASIDYNGNTLISTIYIRFKVSAEGVTRGSLTATDGTTSKTIELSATGKSSAGGIETSVVWPLTSNATPVVTGSITPLEQTMSNMTVSGYQNINKAAVWPEGSNYDASHTVQRNCVAGNKWPAGEIDEVSDRFIQFGVSAPENTSIDIDKISMYVAGAGGNGMRCKIYYSTDAQFANPVQIKEFASMTSNTAYLVTAEPVLTLDEGESLYLRIYPWYSGEATGKTICLSDVTIHGVAKSGNSSAQARYSLTTKVSPADAGKITVNPVLTSYKKGSEATLTATRNFGFTFKEWQDNNGKTISTEPTTTITIDADKDITAVFVPLNVYTVTARTTNDMEMSLGSVTISPNNNGNKYEEGTEIVATANESKILKFLSWTDDNENAGNNAIRNLKVNGNIELVANYEVQDFIAVFDASKVQGYAYNTTAEYPYNADVVWDASRNAKASIVRVSDGSLVYTQNGGTPVVRSRESATLSGLNGLYQNGYRTTDVAFQYQFSTIGFTSATMYAGMAAKNMASANWKAQISTDGKSFADIDGAKWTITANVLKDDIAISLPESAMDKNLVTIRIVGDGDATLSTSYQFDKKFDGLDYCDHSETGFGNVFILGTAKVVKDNDAPVVTSVLPTNGSTGTSSSGTITVSFNERIRSANLVNGKVTISGGGETKELEPTWNSRSVSFNYFNLKYGTTYNFVMPAGFAEDLSGNAAPEVKVEFTVMDRQKPAQRTFNAIVDHSLCVDKIEASADMPAQYRYIQDAIDDAPSASAKPYLIYIKEGYYKDPNKTFNASYGMKYADTSAGSTSTETVQIPGGANEYDKCNLVCVNKPNIHLIGQAVDKVTIAGDRLDGGCSDRTRVWYHINAGASMEVTAAATDFFMENVTLVNEAWTVEKMAGPQALALNMSSDRAVINNCNVRSYQDTYYSASTYNRQFWNNSTIEGAVDFIYGSGDVFFEGCTLKIVRQAGGYIVAPNHPANTRWGYVFNNTKIVSGVTSPSSDTKVYFGRPWHETPMTVFLHTQSEVTPYDGIWYPTMGGLPKLWAVYDMWDANGYARSTESISDYYYTDKATGNKVSGKAKNFLTDDEAKQYTIENVFSGDKSSGKTGYWNPQPIVEKTSTPVLSLNGNVITWNADDYAICYVVTVNGKAVSFPTECRFVANVGDVVSVQSVNEHGALSDASESVTVLTTDIKNISANRNTESDASFSVNGMKLNKPSQHGVYIENGKKVYKK